MSSQKVYLITGCSTGLGRGFAEYFLKANQKVVVTARDVSKVAHFEKEFPNTALALALDVTDENSVNDAVEKTVQKFGHIDVLINNAGYGQFGPLEEVTKKQITAQMDTNFFGLINITQRVLPIMRQQKSGHIIQISSVGGQVAYPGFSLYHASKWAVEGLSESLAKEVAPFNVRVTIVEPGSFKSEFADRAFDEGIIAYKNPEYEASVGMLVKIGQAVRGLEPGNPWKAAAAIHKVVESAKPPLRLPLGEDSVLNILKKKKDQVAELEEWRQVSESTDFDNLSDAAKAVKAQVAAALLSS
jgi:NADP-dependent 3-hydroxy acid dehydrogenase YdfG